MFNIGDKVYVEIDNKVTNGTVVSKNSHWWNFIGALYVVETMHGFGIFWEHKVFIRVNKEESL